MTPRVLLSLYTALLLLVSSATGGSLFAPDSTVRRSRSFHVLHYKLELSFDQRARTVAGTASIVLTPLGGRLDSVVLDAVAMNVRSAGLRDGKALAFHNRTPRLAVLLDRTYAVGETLCVSIVYSCAPLKGLYFIRADSAVAGRHDQIWTQGEDMDNRNWFPCYDYPNDKATSEVIATVPGDFTLLSNGRLLGETFDRRAGTRTFHWYESKPHSSYLVMIAAGRYTVLRARYREVPLMYYMYPEDTAKAVQTFGRTPAMMKFFEEKTGMRYPWEKYAQIIIDDFMWGGMENTTAVTLNDATVVDARAALDFPSDPVVAHELAHMWWGDLVTPRDWDDLWLNEGFATYFESLFASSEKGEDEFQYQMMLASSAVRNNDRFFGRKPIVCRNSDPVNLYSRGAWVLHMLRSLLGDEAFWRGLRSYAAKYEFACAETAEFALALEDATGQNLGWFFDQWVFRAGLPKLRITKAWDDSAHVLHLTVTQEQQTDSLTGIFRFPLVVECTTPSGRTSRTFWVENREEEFSLPLDGAPLMVIADKGYRLLKEMEFPKSKEEYIYQLVHAEDIADRMAAVRSLPEYQDDPGVRDALWLSARSDGFWGVRRSALEALSEMSPLPGVYLDASHDLKSMVRYTAADNLSRYRGPEVAARLDSMALEDSSYLVASTALSSLASVDSSLAFEAARCLIAHQSYRNLLRTGALRALRTSRDPRGIEVALPYVARGYENQTRTLAIAVLGDMGRDSSSARSALDSLLIDPVPAVREAVVGAVAEWNDPHFTQKLLDLQAHEPDPGVLAALKKALSTLIQAPPEQDNR